MKIHEYQAKAILSNYGVTVPRGKVACTKEEAWKIAQELGGLVVVKAQIHAGGRGKGGGIRLAHTPDEARAIADSILGMQLVTHQTGPEGQTVKRVLVEEGLKIRQEYYLGIAIDRDAGKVVVMASREGGVDIEKVAAEKPELILKETLEPGLGLTPFQARKLAFGLDLPAKLAPAAVRFMHSLYQAFDAADASLAEINPLLLTEDGRFYALDAKINFDDNALYRHPRIRELRDTDEEDPLEVEAGKHGLSYIKLDGNVGCMVNGAGLAMATMDIIKLAGGAPANFLDVGGGATADQVRKAFGIILSDSNVEAVLINIFGGIMRCDIVARGVVEAAKSMRLEVPIVVRLEGTNLEQGQEILQASGLSLTVASGMQDAAEKVVRLASRSLA
jgi:succinyl-CoA synthetase beta subunit